MNIYNFIMQKLKSKILFLGVLLLSYNAFALPAHSSIQNISSVEAMFSKGYSIIIAKKPERWALKLIRLNYELAQNLQIAEKHAVFLLDHISTLEQELESIRLNNTQLQERLSQQEQRIQNLSVSVTGIEMRDSARDERDTKDKHFHYFVSNQFLDSLNFMALYFLNEINLNVLEDEKIREVKSFIKQAFYFNLEEHLSTETKKGTEVPLTEFFRLFIEFANEQYFTLTLKSSNALHDKKTVVYTQFKARVDGLNYKIREYYNNSNGDIHSLSNEYHTLVSDFIDAIFNKSHNRT